MLAKCDFKFTVCYQRFTKCNLFSIELHNFKTSFHTVDNTAELDLQQ